MKRNKLRIVIIFLAAILFLEIYIIIAPRGLKLGNILSGFKSQKIAEVVEKDSYENEEVVNILLLGLDRRSKDEPCRTDSMMVLTIDKKNKSVKASSLMRDMYVDIPGNKGNKINSAYTYGGPQLSIETVNSCFGLNIRDFVSADFFGFPKLIDSLGGVEIDVKPNEVPLCGVEKSGPQLLNGEQALAYSRIRKVGNSDFERTERQRRVLNQLYKKVKYIDVSGLELVIKEILPNVETSLNYREIINIASQIKSFDKESISELRIPVNGYFKNETINKMSCLVPDIEENKRLLQEFIYK